MLFTGEYEHTIDAKQRLAIPAEVRSQIRPEEHGEALYLVPGANGHLWLWPERTFERMASDIEQSLVPAAEMMEFEELIFPQSKRLEIDKAGRVRLPEQVLGDFGLGQTVMVLGMGDHLELRDPVEWRQRRDDNKTKLKEIMLKARQEMLRKSSPNGGQKERP